MNTRTLFFSLLLSLLAGLASAAETTVATRVLEARGVAMAAPVDGVVEAVRQVTLAAQVAGRVLEVRVDAGDRVSQGQLLARIDVRESAEVLAAAKAAVTVAKSGLLRTEKLVAQKFLSAAALDKAQADYDAASAQMAAARSVTAHGEIVSPVSGVVAARHLERGELATPGQALFSLYQPGALRMVVYVPQARLAEVNASQQALIEFADKGRQLLSRKIEVLPTIDRDTHNATVRIELPASEGLIVPGMAGRVRFVAAESQRMTVPKTAVLHRGEVTGIYIKDAQGRFRLRQIRLGELLVDGEREVLAGAVSGEVFALDPVKAALAARQ